MESLSEFIQKAEITKQSNELWTVHTNGLGNPGKIYDCQGESEYEICENAYTYLKALEESIHNNHSEE